MSLDRDLWLDVVFNVSTLRAAGLTVETRWNSSVRLDSYGWLDPLSKDFGPNAKYFKHDVAEAKKLLSAAGYATGVDLISTVPSGTPYGADHIRQVEVTEGMAHEAGFRSTIRQVDYTAEFLPKYRASRGKFEGWAHRTAGGGAGSGNEAIGRMYALYYSKAGDSFLGFSASGKSDGAGDSYVDAQLEKAVIEIDGEKRNAIGYDLQRYLAKALYEVKWPGGTTSFLPAWPVLRNYQVFKTLDGNPRPDLFYWWLDETRAPIKRT